MLTLNALTLAAARQIIFAAETKAYQLVCPCTISVVDMNGQPIAQVRMDGALAGRVVESTHKALNALAVGLCLILHDETGGSQRANFEALASEVFGGQIPIGWGDDIIGTTKVKPGGIVIKSQGRLLGAIGVSSGTPEDDHAIALAALDAYTSCLTNDQSRALAAETLSGNSFFEFR